jgi:hypothetical protein
MKRNAKSSGNRRAALMRWAQRLDGEVRAVVQRHPEADADNVRLTLLALQVTPEERLARSLRRGRGFAVFRT